MFMLTFEKENAQMWSQLNSDVDQEYNKFIVLMFPLYNSSVDKILMKMPRR